MEETAPASSFFRSFLNCSIFSHLLHLFALTIIITTTTTTATTTTTNTTTQRLCQIVTLLHAVIQILVCQRAHHHCMFHASCAFLFSAVHSDRPRHGQGVMPAHLTSTAQGVFQLQRFGGLVPRRRLPYGLNGFSIQRFVVFVQWSKFRVLFHDMLD